MELAFAQRPTLSDLGEHLPGGEVIELPVELDSPLEHLERYTVLRLIGAGGMGKIYQAYDSLLERNVALKVMHADVPAREQRRFRREAILGARLLHPCLVRVYDMGVDERGQTEWMAMEYLPGTDMLKLLDVTRARGKGVPWPALVRGLSQVLMALQYLHDCRVVHCDVKPANMFVTRDPNTRFLTTKLLDLGIAYDLDGPRPGPNDPLCGDPNYIAPEQTVHGGVIDPRTDIYAVGVSLYELATGVLPFEELTSAPLHDLLVAQREATPPPPSSRLPAGTPPELADRLDWIFARACAKDPARRYPSARAMQAALNAE